MSIRIRKVKCPGCNLKFKPEEYVEANKLIRKVKKNKPDANRELVQEGKICTICGSPLDIIWTIKHGEGYCAECGAPYLLYDYNQKGQLVDNLRCGIKENFRSAYRHIYLKHKGDFESFTADHSNRIVSSSSDKIKTEIIEQKSKAEKVKEDKVKGITSLTANEILECLEFEEQRDIKTSNETIKLIDKEGVLVTQKALGEDKEPKFYTYKKLREIYSRLPR